MNEHKKLVRAILAAENLSGIQRLQREEELENMPTEELRSIYFQSVGVGL